MSPVICGTLSQAICSWQSVNFKAQEASEEQELIKVNEAVLRNEEALAEAEARGVFVVGAHREMEKCAHPLPRIPGYLFNL